ncbi:hypothetical protein F750_3191 [Streptomyces sp. PAMC 26508]|nr:hypothetical protein F750_3191 [Streptomyces sp. PAMC 26508]
MHWGRQPKATMTAVPSDTQQRARPDPIPILCSTPKQY